MSLLWHFSISPFTGLVDACASVAVLPWPRVTGHWASKRKVSGEQRQLQFQCQVCPTMPKKQCPPAIRHSATVLATGFYCLYSVQIMCHPKTDKCRTGPFLLVKNWVVSYCWPGHKPFLFSSEAARSRLPRGRNRTQCPGHNTFKKSQSQLLVQMSNVTKVKPRVKARVC